MNLPFSLDFTSVVFLAAVAVLSLLSGVLPKKALPYFLLAVSLLYYVALAPLQFPVLLVASAAIYFFGITSERTRGVTATVGICGVILLLAVTKYLPPVWSRLFPGQSSILAPLGISYFTFSGISYLAEVKKGKIPQKSYTKLLLYLMFFPKVTSGPIEKADVFFGHLEQLEAEGAKKRRIREGILLVLCGLLRKLAVSNLLAGAVASVFDEPGAQNGLAVILAALCYTIQIYGDFSGYTDIARGTALLFGIPLEENFRRPYLATDLKEFWRRWHISLSSFLRDYIYIPLGGNRKGKARKYLNILIVFTLSGLWHGANLTFVLWGVLHGLL